MLSETEDSMFSTRIGDLKLETRRTKVIGAVPCDNQSNVMIAGHQLPGD